MNLDELKAEFFKDEEIKKEYDNLEVEYELVQLLIDERKKANMSQEDLANSSGINRTDISKLENARANPSLKTLKRLANSFGKKLEIKFV